MFGEEAYGLGDEADDGGSETRLASLVEVYQARVDGAVVLEDREVVDDLRFMGVVGEVKALGVPPKLATVATRGHEAPEGY